MPRLITLFICFGVAACGPSHVEPDGGAAADAAVAGPDASVRPTPWADRLVSYMPGEGAGFGQDQLPDVVLGAPRGGGSSTGGLDVLSLGRQGSIVLAFEDLVTVDGPGDDLRVFENPFSGFLELARVAVSDDGTTWHEFPCAADDVDGGFPGCAGVGSVFGWDGGVDVASLRALGGDAYDLSTLGLSRARFVRLTDTGTNRFYATPSGGFDLDAVCAVNNGPR